MKNIQKKVLLIEDDDLQTQVIKAIFSMKFPKVELVISNTATEGINNLKSDHYDLLILDLMLPDRDGLEIIDEISALPTPPIIVVTSLSDDDAVLKTKVLDIVAYIVKPVDKDFISLVRSILINYN